VSVPVVAFFNNKGGVGKTSLVYHLAIMLAQLNVRVLAADLDPQCNLTAMFIDEDLLETIWEEDGGATIYNSVKPLVRGTGDIGRTPAVPLGDTLYAVFGDLLLSSFEEELSSQWPSALDGKERAFRVLSALWRMLQDCAAQRDVQVILTDLGPNLGSINRAALIAADYVVVPLAPDLFSLQGLRNLGPAFRNWRREWQDRVKRRPVMDTALPEGKMQPIGYVVQQYSVRLDRPVKAYEKWMNRIPADYRRHVLCEPFEGSVSLTDDPHKLALLRNYRSLMPMAQEARKPMFALKPADGAIGAQQQAVQDVYREFKALALSIASRIDLPVPALS
jgi:cellulose biosynthesis protein BcsQ